MDFTTSLVMIWIISAVVGLHVKDSKWYLPPAIITVVYGFGYFIYSMAKLHYE